MKLITNNKKAGFNYFLSDFIQAGVVLEGSEVKSLRSGQASLDDSFVFIKDGEVFLKNCYIKPYEKSSSFTPDSRRSRKLLLNRGEITKLTQKMREKGYSCVPTKMYFENGLVKVEIALAKGKKLYDKRDTLKDKSVKKDIEIAARNFDKNKI